MAAGAAAVADVDAGEGLVGYDGARVSAQSQDWRRRSFTSAADAVLPKIGAFILVDELLFRRAWLSRIAWAAAE